MTKRRWRLPYAGEVLAMVMLAGMFIAPFAAFGAAVWIVYRLLFT